MNTLHKVLLHRISGLRQCFALGLRNVYTCQVLLDLKKFNLPEEESRAETRLKAQDKVPSTFRLVYRAPMKSYVMMNQVTSTIGVAVIGIGGIYRAANTLMLDLPMSSLLATDVMTPVELGSIVTISTMFLVVLMYFNLRYPLRIYRCENTSRYIYLKYGWIPLMTHKYETRSGCWTAKKEYDNSQPLQFYYDSANKSTLIVFKPYFRSSDDLAELQVKPKKSDVKK
ncbi:uncharacterized protein LOC132193495 [Neocloeon triangulifer]|uniref:uncharacterized protein LOC132193495 n=1 Tax=Neocloeon triangulifer TaxID=2078957 RepID=UPI00286F76D8|nr:uncharacterized protein LOC132193495 [Neocloeon triangulifer]